MANYGLEGGPLILVGRVFKYFICLNCLFIMAISQGAATRRNDVFVSHLAHNIILRSYLQKKKKKLVQLLSVACFFLFDLDKKQSLNHRVFSGFPTGSTDVITISKGYTWPTTEPRRPQPTELRPCREEPVSWLAKEVPRRSRIIHALYLYKLQE